MSVTQTQEKKTPCVKFVNIAYHERSVSIMLYGIIWHGTENRIDNRARTRLKPELCNKLINQPSEKRHNLISKKSLT